MFSWIFGNKYKKLEEETKQSFSAVKRDMDVVGKWIKHLDGQEKQLFGLLHEVQREISSIKDELESVREALDLTTQTPEHKQLFEKASDLDKQTAVVVVGKAVQTAVQTSSFYEIFKNLTANERLVLFTIMNSDMKLSYEDLALLLGKEKSTIRGQINAIKQKSEGLIEEVSERNGKKRVFVPQEIKEKLAKYAKVRVKKNKKTQKIEDI